MKRMIFTITVFGLITLIIFFGLRVYENVQAKNNIARATACLPGFSFKALNGSDFGDKNLQTTEGKIIINLFSPDCEHCQYMASSFARNKDLLQNLTLIMVTTADSSSITKFSGDYKLAGIPNIILLRDAEMQFPKIFGTAMVPSFFVYQDRKLLKKINGETKVENLLKP